MEKYLFFIITERNNSYFNQINLLSRRGKKFFPSLVFELIKRYNKHLEKNQSKLGEIIKSKLIYE